MQEQWSTIDALVGFSMGVQVSLEFAVLYPECVSKLVLLNGTHGHIFDTAFQPLLRVPLLPNVLHALVSALQRHPHLLAVRSPSPLCLFTASPPPLRRCG